MNLDNSELDDSTDEERDPFSISAATPRTGISISKNAAGYSSRLLAINSDDTDCDPDYVPGVLSSSSSSEEGPSTSIAKKVRNQSVLSH